jgi:hypothetical protein
LLTFGAVCGFDAIFNLLLGNFRSAKAGLLDSPTLRQHVAMIGMLVERGCQHT